MKNVRESPAYYQRTLYDLLGMIRQLGTPTWFVTLSPADLKWTDMIQIIGRQYGKILTAEMISQMTFEEKSMWIRSNPVTAARHFQYRLNTFIHKFLLSFNIIGQITDFAIRIEFQQRGSPHAHMIFWIANVPKLGIADENAITQFINQYVSCSIPADNDILRTLVLQLQQHTHSSYWPFCKIHIEHCQIVSIASYFKGIYNKTSLNTFYLIKAPHAKNPLFQINITIYLTVTL